MKRTLDTKLNNHFSSYKQVMVLIGARQVGKTTILKKLFPTAQYLLADNQPIRELLESYDINTYKQLIKSKQVIIDEVQQISDPGRMAKIIYDQIPGIKLIITGSSALNIKNKVAESLAGRKIEYKMFPLTFSEYLVQNGIENDLGTNFLSNITTNKSSSKVYTFNAEKILENVLLYGLYPYLIENPQNKKYLLNLVDSVIFKDIFGLALIHNRRVAKDLLTLLAYQLGNLINYNDIAQRLAIDSRTVKKYIEIFEQNYIVYRLYPFSKNKRNEIGTTPKIYFYDTGIRNALIENFQPLAIRADRGALFENFIIMEALKETNYTEKSYKINYWRTKEGAEVDLVLSFDKDLYGIEIKYTTGKVSVAFKNRYKDAKTKVINTKNFY